MSSKPEDTKPIPKPKGIQPKRSAVVKKASEEVLAAVKQPLPSGQLEAVPQSFAGIPRPPITKTEERVLVKTLTNPVINPLSGPLPPKVPEDTGPSLPAAPIAKKTILKHAKKTSDYTARTQEVSSELQEGIDTKLPPIFKAYQEKQNEIESNSPYLTDAEVYTPQSRKSFYRFISDNYTEAFKLIPQMKGRVDENACAKLGAAAGEAVEAFLYQKFVREYIRNASPYRGVLVYHGLGSGKTCSAIAAAEALYGTANKKIIVMTPYSLQANFMSEISFCGFRHFNVQNHWVAESLISEGGVSYLYANSVLSLSEEYLKRVLRRPEEDRKVIWIPDFTRPINYDELSQQKRDDIRAQITEMIKNRVTFISYNGVTASELKRYACEIDPTTGERLFDNAVIVIDEVHNLTRLMQGEIQPYIVVRKGKKRKIPAEPIVPGKWVPGLCGKPLNYKRPYLFYKLLSDARNSKVIGLSGTPIINFPEELGILANVLAGYTECAELSFLTTDPAKIKRFKEIALEEPRVDIIRFKAGRGLMTVLISVFNEGYERVIDEDNVNDFIGVKYNADAQDDIRTVYERIKARLLGEKIPIGEEQYVSYPRLPLDDETFRDRFINSTDLSLQNKVVLQKRLTGLISYYKGSKEEYMPRVTKDEIVRCDMSDYILSKYTVERKKEIEGESKKKEEGGDAFATVEEFAKMKNPSSYRFRSRALCNFAFPKSIERPFPGSLDEEEEEVTQVEDIDTAEVSIETEEDLAAQALAAHEDEAIEGPEAEEEAEGEGAKEAVEVLEAEKAKAVSLAATATAAATQGGYNEDEEQEEQEEEVDEEFEVIEEEDDTEDDDEDIDDKEEKNEEEDEDYENIQEGGQGSNNESGTSSEKPSVSALKPKRVRPKVAPATVLSTAVVETVPIVSVAPVAEPPASSVVQQAKPLRRRPVVAPVTVPAVVKEEEEVKEEAEEEAEAKPLVQRVLTYKERIARALSKLEANSDKFLKLESAVPEARLAQYSTKLDHILRRINNSKGSNLVYSQFKTVEGLGVLGIALKANGFVEIKIEGSDNAPYFSAESEASLRKGPVAKEKRFITFTGGETRDRRALNLNVFNGNLDKLPANMRAVLEESGYGEKRNQYGEICWVIGITGAGAEGISLKCCRSVHIMEPYWNNVRLDQVKGRAIRICSHQDLPFKDREVEIYTYYSVFSAEQKNSDKIDMTIRTTDENETSDEKVYNVSLRKDKVNQELLNIMKESAMDCGLNAADNDGVKCFVVDGKPDQYLFDPDLDTDIIQTNIELREVKEVKEDIRDPAAAAIRDILIKTTSTAATDAKVEEDDVPVMEWKGVSYLMYPKKGSGGLVYQLYAMTDESFKKPLGELAINPGTGTFDGSIPVIY